MYKCSRKITVTKFFSKFYRYKHLPSLAIPRSIVTPFSSLVDSSRLNPAKSALTFLNPKHIIIDRRLTENKMDPTTAVYMTDASSSAFPIKGGKYVEVDPGSRIRKDSFDRNSNKKNIKLGLSPSEKIFNLLQWKPFKNDEKCLKTHFVLKMFKFLFWRLD